MTADDARRGTLREHGETDRGIYFGKHPKHPIGDGVPVRIAREAPAIRLRDMAGNTVEAFGDTTKFWLAPGAGEPDTPTAATPATVPSSPSTRGATVAAAQQMQAAERAALLTSYRLTAQAIDISELTPDPVRQTWAEAGTPARFLYFDRDIDPGRPILATTRDGSRIHDARTGHRIAHYASPVRMWIAPAPDPVPAPAVIIVGCSRAKEPGRLPAGRKYLGSFHHAARRAAAVIAARTGGQLLILSARHGLVTLDTEVDNYDLSIGDPGAVTAARIAEQAAALGITGAAVTVLAGRRYADLISQVWADAARPLDGARGIGEQRARLKAITHQAADATGRDQHSGGGPA